MGKIAGPPEDAWKVFTAFFVLAAVAGFMKALGNKLSLTEALIAAGTAGVGGLVVGAICIHAWGPQHWYLTSAVVGVAGWVGGQVILDALAGTAAKWLPKKKDH